MLSKILDQHQDPKPRQKNSEGPEAMLCLKK